VFVFPCFENIFMLTCRLKTKKQKQATSPSAKATDYRRRVIGTIARKIVLCALFVMSRSMMANSSQSSMASLTATPCILAACRGIKKIVANHETRIHTQCLPVCVKEGKSGKCCDVCVCLINAMDVLSPSYIKQSCACVLHSHNPCWSSHRY